MAKIKPLFKFIAVLNAVLLFGGYVCYRGGIVRAFGAKPAAYADQEDPQRGNAYSEVTPNSANVGTKTRTEIMPGPKSTVFQTDTANTLDNSFVPDPGIYVPLADGDVKDGAPASIRRTEIMPGPKSSPFMFENEPKPDRKIIMSGSKSLSSSPVIWDTNSGRTWPSKHAETPGAVYSEVKEVAPAHAQSPVSTPRTVIMSGSKDDRVIFESGNQPATATTTDKPAQQSAVRPQAAPQKRVIMGGSKSARVEFTPDPPQTAERQQAVEKPTVQRRVIMSGSKSGMTVNP
jgi:hypothetical protein